MASASLVVGVAGGGGRNEVTRDAQVAILVLSVTDIVVLRLVAGSVPTQILGLRLPPPPATYPLSQGRRFLRLPGWLRS